MERFPNFNLSGTKYRGRGSQMCWSTKDVIAAVKSLENFFLVDAASEEYLCHVQWQLDNERDHDWGTSSPVMHHIGKHHRDAGLLKSILQLGADPDTLDASGQTVSRQMRCSYTFTEGARVFVKCRPDLTLLIPPKEKLEDDDASPGAGAIREVDEVLYIWKKYKKFGPPSLAKLAHNQEWWAVLNLCRRRVIGQEEKERRFKGKTAVQWAKHHGQDKVAEELVYLLELTPEDTSTEEVQKSNSSEIEDMKEMFLLTISKMNEEHEQVKNELASLKKELLALTKKRRSRLAS